MEEIAKRNGKGVWMREIEKIMKRFDASFEWLIGRIELREEALSEIRQNDQIEEREKDRMLRTRRMMNIEEVLAEVEARIDTHFFNEFSQTKSSIFPKKVMESQNSIEMKLFMKTWRSLSCYPKTMKIIREIQENLLCVGKRRELITKKRTESKCLRPGTGSTTSTRM